MAKHNIYKTIVLTAAACLLFAFFAKWVKNSFLERTYYGFTLQANSDLTEDIVAEFEKIPRICRFEPVQTVTVTIRLNQYSMEATLVGLDLNENKISPSPPRRTRYPAIKLKKADAQITLGNTPALFFGADTFSLFSDAHGYTPEKSQIQAWINEYQKLELTITDEANRTKKGKICGILEEPKDQIYIEKNQMQELFGSSAHILGGHMEIYGRQNTKKAQKLLEGAGFVITETKPLLLYIPNAIMPGSKGH